MVASCSYKTRDTIVILTQFPVYWIGIETEELQKGLKDHSAFDSWSTPEKEWYTSLKTRGVDTVVHYFKMIGLSRHIVYNDFLKIIRWNDIGED